MLEDEGTTVTSRQIPSVVCVKATARGKESSEVRRDKASTPAQRQQASGRTDQRRAQPGDPSPAG
ncbi:hypothetical protein KIF59_18670 [Enterobacter cloacae subsp. cloacae]|nr:hypothetical protein [Enterobacter cloacae subsp. cloacae]